MATHEHLPRTGWLEQLRRPPVQALVGLGIMLTFMAFGLVGELSGRELRELHRAGRCRAAARAGV